MTNRERLALLDAAVTELERTTKGYAPTKGSGPHWRTAMRRLDALATDLGRKPEPPPAPKPPLPPAYSGLFAKDGLMMRTPDGNAETKAREGVARGYVWVAGNIGDGHDWDDWDTAGTFVPWCRVYTPADLERLLDQAWDSRSPGVIVNLEDEAKTVLSPTLVASIIKSRGQLVGEVAISMVGWLYNDVDWKPLAGFPFLLQVFDAYRDEIPACVQHAHDEGVRTAFPTLQAYGVANGHPQRNGWTGPISIFTGDDVDVWP